MRLWHIHIRSLSLGHSSSYITVQLLFKLGLFFRETSNRCIQGLVFQTTQTRIVNALLVMGTLRLTEWIPCIVFVDYIGPCRILNDRNATLGCAWLRIPSWGPMHVHGMSTPFGDRVSRGIPVWFIVGAAIESMDAIRTGVRGGMRFDILLGDGLHVPGRGCVEVG